MILVGAKENAKKKRCFCQRKIKMSSLSERTRLACRLIILSVSRHSVTLQGGGDSIFAGK